MADATQPEEGDSFEQRLYIALGEADAMPLRDLLIATTNVAIAELKVQLKADAQSALTKLHGYCKRWGAKSTQQPHNTLDDSDDDGPDADEPYHPMREFERQRRDPNAYNPVIDFDREWRPWAYAPRPVPSLPPLPPPPAWDTKSVQDLRGTLRGALRQLIRDGSSRPRGSTAGRASATPTVLPIGKSGGRPSADVIDLAAHDYLFEALQAAKTADQKYVPNRMELAAAVSRKLSYTIKIASLFGTRPLRHGTRVPRYPKFLALWKRTQSASQDARRGRG